MNRRSLRALSWALIGALLYAQAAIAAYACPREAPAATPSTTIAVAAEVAPVALNEQAPAPMADCTGMGTAIDPSSPLLCAEHCQFGQQSNQSPTLAVPAVLLSALYFTPPLPESSGPSHAVVIDAGALAAASPPHAILHCCFRI